ncbi:MAG TPA: ADP-ribosylglycohydrolase family protein, partial [Firmicutes bacterium]|nr:ADP-ribosylglycohydrolase family protein [Bacillota bacterium]
MAGYQTLNILLKEELDQLAEEGRVFDRKEMEDRIQKAGQDRQALMRLYEEMGRLPVREDYAYTEPSEYEEILPLCRLGNTARLVEEVELFDRMYGAWLGRCVGCALGQPVELWSREAIREWCELADAWPLDNYLPAHSRAEEKGVKLNNTYSTRDNLRHMPTDDDIRYTIIGLNLMKSHGDSWDSWDVGGAWVYGLPFRQLCTAENQAYLNFINVDENGPWGKPEHAMELLKRNKVNTYLNPYREWIGAQIRIDAYGYACAGDPHRAAKLAYTDAYFSHV